MSEYTAPLADMRFALEEAAGLSDLAALPPFEAVEPDLVDAILQEAGKLAGEVLAPINQSGDKEGCVFENGVVRMPAGFPGRASSAVGHVHRRAARCHPLYSTPPSISSTPTPRRSSASTPA